MKLRPASAFLLPALLLASCGGGASYGSVSEAMQAAERARAGKNAETAASAYEYVLANSQAPAEQQQALVGLYDVQLQSNDQEGAVATFARLQAEHADLMTVEKCIQMIDKAILARAVDAADQTLNKALAAHPDAGEKFSRQATAVDLFKEKGPDADMSSLGYTGD